MKEKRLHTHPNMERMLNIPPDKVIIDRDFANCFKSCNAIPGAEKHIIVDKIEFEKVLRQGSVNEDIDAQKAARINRDRILAEIKDGYKKHGDINFYIIASAIIERYGVDLFIKGVEYEREKTTH